MNHAARLFLALLAIAGSPISSENPYIADLGSSARRPILVAEVVSPPPAAQDGPADRCGTGEDLTACGNPLLTVHLASPAQLELLRWAVGRFTEIGFPLPPLDVTFHNDRGECRGFNGTHQLKGEVAVINICVSRRHTILHELGHAWEARAVTDETREEFMHYRGLTSWNDPDVDWDERGIEQAAVTLAMVLKWQSGSIDNPEFVKRLCSYEVLTGRPLPNSVPVNCEINRPVASPNVEEAS
jgi:hypothetical protein